MYATLNNFKTISITLIVYFLKGIITFVMPTRAVEAEQWVG